LWRVGWIFWVFFLFTMCPPSSHQVFKRFPKMFPIAPQFYPICFAQSYFLFTLYVGQP
jgi:hypothetical protein